MSGSGSTPKRVLSSRVTKLDAEDKGGIKAYRRHLKLEGAVTDPFNVTVAACVLHSVMSKYRNKPGKRGFLRILASCHHSGAQRGRPSFCVEQAAAIAKTLHVRKIRGGLPYELAEWVEGNRGRKATRVPESVFRELDLSLRSAFARVSTRMLGQELRKRQAGLNLLVKLEEEDLAPIMSPQPLSGADNTAVLGHSSSLGEDVQGPENTAEVSEDTAGALRLAVVPRRVLPIPGPRDSATPPNFTPEAPIDSNEIPMVMGLPPSTQQPVNSVVTERSSEWNPHRIYLVDTLPLPKSRQPMNRPDPPHYLDNEGCVASSLKPVPQEALVVDANGAVVAGVSRGLLSSAAHAAVVKVLRNWARDNQGRVPNGILHYGVKRPRMAPNPAIICEIDSSGSTAFSHLRRVEEALLQSRTLAAAEQMAKLVDAMGYKVQADAFLALERVPKVRHGLPLGEAFEHRVINLNSIATRAHCDPGDWGFTVIIVFGAWCGYLKCWRKPFYTSSDETALKM